jgi:hypothetical protein
MTKTPVSLSADRGEPNRLYRGDKALFKGLGESGESEIPK